MNKSNLLLVIILCCSITAFAKGDRKRDPMKGIMKELNLNETQLAQLKAMRKEFKKGDHKAQRNEMKELHKQMKEAFVSNADDSKILELHKKITAKRNVFEEEKINKMLKLKSILTLDQKKKYVELMFNRKKKNGKKD